MAAEQVDLRKKKSTIINRYGLVVILLLTVFVAVFVFIVRIMFFESDFWRTIGENETVKKDRVIKPTRGNIYAVDGRVLATSEPLYIVGMDFMAEGIRKDSLMKYVGPLSAALAKKFPERNASQYKNLILDGWDKSRKELKALEENKKNGGTKKVRVTTRSVRLIKRDINYLELKGLRQMPFFNQPTHRTGLWFEERNMRDRPFGNLASRTVGTIYKDIEKGGASGLELKYDSILRGAPGVKSRQKIQGRWIDIIEMPAEDGLDIESTLDVDIQDVAERALTKKLTETEAESGTAVVMEVATGEIKAIVNLDRLSGGGYAEGNPNAFSYMHEPGSTFKMLSIMVALEDGVVRPEDKFDVGSGLYKYGNRMVRDHYWRKGIHRGEISVSEGINISSNVLVSKVILKGYENDPGKFVKRLYDMGVTKKIDWDVPLKGKEGTAVIRFPNDKSSYWSKTTLPWMSFGYETQVPPIYILMFYNGIANGGKMIKPFLTKAFTKDGKIVKEFTTDVINPSLCSARTLKEVQEMLVGVVNEGTGLPVKSKSFQIAGKTGTAQIASGGSYSGHFVSFCGYFPAEKPMYTCFVGIKKPKGIPSGGGMPGAVFKQIAEEIYAKNIFAAPSQCKPDSVLTLMPYAKNGIQKNLKTVLDKLNISYTTSASDSDWVITSTLQNKLDMSKNAIQSGIVPSVIGMGLRDAMYLLEKSGYKVSIVGYGKVTNQSVTAGGALPKGSQIVLTLN